MKAGHEVSCGTPWSQPGWMNSRYFTDASRDCLASENPNAFSPS